jgi:hypothetical protein
MLAALTFPRDVGLLVEGVEVLLPPEDADVVVAADELERIPPSTVLGMTVFAFWAAVLNASNVSFAYRQQTLARVQVHLGSTQRPCQPDND